VEKSKTAIKWQTDPIHTHTHTAKKILFVL